MKKGKILSKALSVLLKDELPMKKGKLLSKTLSVLLSGAMLAGMIPAVSMTAGATAYGFHTADGYVSEWSYSFEKGFDGTQWKSEDNDEDTHGWDVIENKALAHCGGISMRSQSKIIGGESLTPDNWLYSPLIQLSEDKELLLNFYAKGQYNTFGVYIAVGRYNYDSYVQLGSDYTISATGWNEYTIDLSEYAGKFIHLAFVHHKSSSTQDLFLDCVDISGRPKGYTMTRSWGFEDVEFAGEDIVANVPSGFIAADKDKDGDTWEVINANWYAHSGNCSLRSRQNGPDVVMNNWLRLPRLWLDNGKDYLLTFYVSDSFAYQTVDVYLYGDKCYDGNVTPEDLDGDDIQEYFSKVLTEDIAIVGKVSGWHEVKVDLSDYAGQYVYVAIVQHGGEGEMRVDDIALWQRDAHTPDGDRTNVYFEGFENEDRKLPEGWDTFDEDGDGNSWNAYYGGSDKKHHGKGGVYSKSYNGKALTPDNWLVMPSYKVSTTKKTTLTFEAVGSHYEDYNEVFGVFISVDGGEFKQVGKDYTTSYAWQEVEVDLTPYAGKSVRVAVVHHNCTDQERLLLDCFNIWEEPFPPIEKIDVTVDRPMVGETVPIGVADYAKLTAASYDITCDSNACIWMKTSKKNYETIESPVYSVIWEDETFSADYVYALVANFQLDEGYSFADGVKITVNGFTHSCKVSENHKDNTIAVSVAFYPLEAYITDVAVTVTEPVIGAVPDTSPTVVTTPDKTFEYFAAWAKALKEDYTTLTGTDWDEIKDPTETFAEGYVYTMAFLMGTHALPQYEFSPDVTATINGKPALSPTESYCYTPSELYAYAVFDLTYVTAHSLNLGSDIGVNFYMDIPEKYAEDETAEIRFSVSGRETVVPVSSGEKTANGLKFTCNVAPAEYDDVITGQLFCNGTAAGNKFTYSVKTYADYILENSEKYSASVPLVNAMLDYCRSAAIYFRGATAPGYTASVTDKNLLAPYKFTVTDKDAAIDYVGQVISLKSKISAKIYFSGKETFAVSDFTVKQGGAAVDAARLSVGSDSRGTYLAISDIAANEMGKAFEIKIGGVTVSNYSVYSYALEAQSGSKKLANVAAALYKFGCAAEAYTGAA